MGIQIYNNYHISATVPRVSWYNSLFLDDEKRSFHGAVDRNPNPSDGDVALVEGRSGYIEGTLNSFQRRDDGGQPLILDGHFL